MIELVLGRGRLGKRGFGKRKDWNRTLESIGGRCGSIDRGWCGSHASSWRSSRNDHRWVRSGRRLDHAGAAGGDGCGPHGHSLSSRDGGVRDWNDPRFIDDGAGQCSGLARSWPSISGHHDRPCGRLRFLRSNFDRGGVTTIIRTAQLGERACRSHRRTRGRSHRDHDRSRSDPRW